MARPPRAVLPPRKHVGAGGWGGGLQRASPLRPRAAGTKQPARATAVLQRNTLPLPPPRESIDSIKLVPTGPLELFPDSARKMQMEEVTSGYHRICCTPTHSRGPAAIGAVSSGSDAGPTETNGWEACSSRPWVCRRGWQGGWCRQAGVLESAKNACGSRMRRLGPAGPGGLCRREPRLSSSS